MRIWSLHPKYLDPKGLVALWRETLLAQKVLLGQTKGYTAHPQLHRFHECADPVLSIGTYLRAVAAEAARRGYAFDDSKIFCFDDSLKMPVRRGQLEYEWMHLLRKLKERAPDLHEAHAPLVRPVPHPLFRIIPGNVEHWERM